MSDFVKEVEMEMELLAMDLGETKVDDESLKMAMVLIKENFKGKNLRFVRKVLFEALYQLKEELIIP